MISEATLLEIGPSSIQQTLLSIYGLHIYKDLRDILHAVVSGTTMRQTQSATDQKSQEHMRQEKKRTVKQRQSTSKSPIGKNLTILSKADIDNDPDFQIEIEC